MRSLSIVIPAMNEEDALPAVLIGLRDIIDRRLGNYATEIIVVDDHSDDGTLEVARRQGVAVISNEYGRGKGNALRFGFAHASGEIIAMMDADGSHNPLELPALLRPLEEGAGLVIGSRILGGSEEYTRLRAFGNIFLSYAFGFFHGRYLSDALNGYKVFRREVFTNYEYTSSDFEIEIELLANALREGYPVVEVPSHECRRQGGQAKSRVLRHGTKFFLRVVRESLKNKLDRPLATGGSDGHGNWMPQTAHHADLDQLCSISRMIAHRIEPRDILQRNLQSLLSTLRATSGSILLVSESSDILEGCLIYGERAVPIRAAQLADMIQQGLAGWVMQNHQAALVPNTRDDPRWLKRPWDAGGEARSAICIPIFSTDRVIGVVTLVRSRTNAFTADELAQLAEASTRGLSREPQATTHTMRQPDYAIS